MGDPYAVLGVSPTASDYEIHRVWRALMGANHPDHSVGDAAAREMRTQRINAAYLAIKRERGARSNGDDSHAMPGDWQKHGPAENTAPRSEWVRRDGRPGRPSTAMPMTDAAGTRQIAGRLWGRAAWLLRDGIGQWIGVGCLIAFVTVVYTGGQVATPATFVVFGAWLALNHLARRPSTSVAGLMFKLVR